MDNTFRPLTSASVHNALQKFLLVWVDANIDESNNDCRHTMEQLRDVVDTVNIFTEPDGCVEFLDGVTKEKIILITSGSLGPDLLRRIHAKVELDAVYVFCGNKERNEAWVEEWSKIKGVFTGIDPLCEALQPFVGRGDENSCPMSFASSNGNSSKNDLNQLDPSFMYTQLFKDAILELKHDGQALKALVKYCRANMPHQRSMIDEFERIYIPVEAIWWYTQECFLYRMLNQALRVLQADVIVTMGFFIHDLHRQIESLHKDQLSHYKGQKFIVYRGQGLSKMDFEKLEKSQGGLLAFNSFISTSREEETAMYFAKNASLDKEKVAILFVITIDPTKISTPFANVEGISYHHNEAEILFSMHSVFRIDRIREMKDHSNMFEVTLTQSTDDDPLLRKLAERLQEEFRGSCVWERIGQLLIKVGQLRKAEEQYKALLKQASDATDKAHYTYQLGYINDQAGKYPKALALYQEALHMEEAILSEDDPVLASYHNNIGAVFKNMGKYSKALSSYRKALEIQRQHLSDGDLALATSFNNIGLVHDSLRQYPEALKFYRHALAIYKEALPETDPLLATCYNNMGLVHVNMGKHERALEFYEQALSIQQKALPGGHPSLANSYDNMGTAYDHMGNYEKALSFHQIALSIYREAYQSNHPSLADCLSSIGGTYKSIEDYPSALSSYRKAHSIYQATLQATHPSLAISHSNMGAVLYRMSQYSDALAHYEKAVAIQEPGPRENHPSLAKTYNDMALVYDGMGEHAKALSSHEKALVIKEKNLKPNDPSIATSHSNLGATYFDLKQYAKALPCFEKALDILQHAPSASQSDIDDARQWIKVVKRNL